MQWPCSTVQSLGKGREDPPYSCRFAELGAKIKSSDFDVIMPFVTLMMLIHNQLEEEGKLRSLHHHKTSIAVLWA